MVEPDRALRVLLVDDQELVRTSLAELLGSITDIQVVGAVGTTADGVQSAEQLQPDVVLMDVLEETHFFDTAADLVRRSCRLLLLDEQPSDANLREALRIGASGYLTKQQPLRQIEAALRQAAQGQRVFTPQVAHRLVLSADGVRMVMENHSHPLARLTPRETDVLVRLAQGMSVKQCAKALAIGVSTVGNHKSRLMKKLNVHKTVDLTRLAMSEGLIPGSRSSRLN